jgi:hypothetical protein
MTYVILIDLLPALGVGRYEEFSEYSIFFQCFKGKSNEYMSLKN